MSYASASSAPSVPLPLTGRLAALGAFAFPDALADCPHRVLSIRRNAEVYAQAAPALYFYQVISGAIRCSRLMSDGRRQIGEFALPGEWLGWDGSETYFYSAEAITDSTLIEYRRKDIYARAQTNAKLTQNVNDVLLRRLTATQERIVLLGRKTALERVASFLHDISERLGKGASDKFALPMSRADIGDYLGLTLETVSRTLTHLQREKVIRLEDAHHVRILDPLALSELTGETVSAVAA
jgi:CRP/FNR family nitrogen fixation transcriptional regulator